MVKSRKLPMETRKTLKDRSVTFTKRRQGLFNKAAELSIICGAQVAILVASPCSKQKIYTFTTHSLIHTLFDAYLSRQLPMPIDASSKLAALSLWHQVKMLETSARNMNKHAELDARPSWDLGEFENTESIQVLQTLAYNLEKLKDKVMTRMNNSDSNFFGFSSNAPPIEPFLNSYYSGGLLDNNSTAADSIGRQQIFSQVHVDEKLSVTVDDQDATTAPISNCGSNMNHDFAEFNYMHHGFVEENEFNAIPENYSRLDALNSSNFSFNLNNEFDNIAVPLNNFNRDIAASYQTLSSGTNLEFSDLFFDDWN